MVFCYTVKANWHEHFLISTHYGVYGLITIGHVNYKTTFSG